MTDQLLKTKLYVPQPRSDLALRPRLIEKLHESSNHKLTLISASAGFGKTTLLSQWIANSDQTVAWLSLDKDDNDPVRFLTYFISALQRIRGDIGAAALDILQSAHVPSYDRILTNLINAIAEIPDPFNIILDDYHVITEQQIHSFVAFVIENLPPPMHLMVASRVDPPWPLASLRARRELTEIRSKDLRFTPEETAALLNDVLGLELSMEELQSLDERVEGWITGLQMVVLSMKGRDDVSGFIKAFTGRNRFILDYLMEEVLNQQPSEIQEFLYKTSFLDQLNPSLCDAVLEWNSGQDILNYLFHANLFLISLDDEGYWFRYHHLFSDLLRKRQLKTHSQEIHELHQRASEWFEKNGFLDEAVRHALALKDTDRIIHLIEANAMPMIYQERLGDVVKLLEKLPEHIKDSHPWLLIIQGWIQADSGNLNAQMIFNRIQGISLDLTDEDAQDKLSKSKKNQLGHVFAILGYCELHKMNYQASVNYLKRALELLAEDKHDTRAFSKATLSAALENIGKLDEGIVALKESIAENDLVGNKLNSALGMLYLAKIFYEKGCLNQAITYAETSKNLAEELKGRSTHLILGQIYFMFGYIQVEKMQLQEAERNILKSIEICEKWERLSQLCASYGILALIMYLNDRYEEASLWIEKAILTAQNYPHQRTYLEIIKAEILLSTGDVDYTEEWVREQDLNIEDEIREWWDKYIVLARLMMAKGLLSDALVVLEKLSAVLELMGVNLYLPYVLVLKAISFEALAERKQALETLRKALRLAESEDHIRPFFENRKSLTNLFDLLNERHHPGEFFKRILTIIKQDQFPSIDRTSSAQQTYLHEPLSERELEVLRFLNSHLSSTEIADELTISANTVRFHIKNIYGKLNVHRRLDAVQKAKDLRLF